MLPRHSGQASGSERDPESSSYPWIPAFAGMTDWQQARARPWAPLDDQEIVMHPP